MMRKYTGDRVSVLLLPSDAIQQTLHAAEAFTSPMRAALSL